MTRILAIAEHVLYGAENTEEVDDFAQGTTPIGDRALSGIRAGYPLNTLDRNIHVDALIQRFRVNQEA